MRKMRSTLLFLGLAAAACTPTVAIQPRGASQNPAAQPGARSFYQRWLTEDVAYIITPEENRAFATLRTDDEREQFIDAFWRRRDARPATEENEYRAEHYVRVDYANENFTAGGVAGWRTDRGRIYITYGKPDEVRKTASGEVWSYRRPQTAGGDLRFEFAHADDLRLVK